MTSSQMILQIELQFSTVRAKRAPESRLHTALKPQVSEHAASIVIGIVAFGTSVQHEALFRRKQLLLSEGLDLQIDIDEFETCNRERNMISTKECNKERVSCYTILAILLIMYFSNRGVTKEKKIWKEILHWDNTEPLSSV